MLLLCSGDIENNPGPDINPQDLRVMHINTQSIRGKIDLIEAESSKFDIITVSESWLSPSDNNNSINLTGFHPPIRRDRPYDPHGGVAIYVRNMLYCKPRPDLQLQGLEAVWIQTKLDQDHLLIGSYYRPPNSPAQYWSLIKDSIQKVNDTGSKFIILGDFNTDWLHNPSHHLTNILNQFQMTQLINTPTRVTNTTSTCLDLIMLQCKHLVTKTEVLPEICSDHQVPCIHIKNNKTRERPFKRTIYNYKKIDHEKFRRLLTQSDLESILSEQDVNSSALNFTNTLFDIANKCMPSKRITIRQNDAAWINDEIKLLINNKNIIHKQAKQKNTAAEWAKFRQARNHLTSKIRERKLQYTKELDAQICDSHNFGTKEWWRLVNTFMSKKGINTNEIPPLELNGQVYYSNKEKADIFNNFFISQSTLLGNNDPIPDLELSNGPILSTIELSENDVKKAIDNLDTNKAVGPDLIHNVLLKAASTCITKPLTNFFNKCLLESKFPDSWKIAHVSPLYKKGPREMPSNYRPISLLSCVGKLFERCIHIQILAFLIQKNFIVQSQSGFIPGDSTINQLLSIYNDICSSFDKGTTTQAIYLDITKAFDRVWHRGLIAKLNAAGIQGSLLNWFKDYLNNRKQAVVIKGQISDFHTIHAGVPQGSVLGPLLFLIYINDIVLNLQSLIKLFADDTSLSLSLADPTRRAEILNEDLTTISLWANKWKVIFNENKTKVVNFIQGADDCEELRLNNNNLVSINEHKHLGLTLQSNLKWDSHIRFIENKVNMLISCLTSYKYKLGRKGLENLYKSYIMPHYDYADIIYDNCSDTLANVLEELHLHAIRTITGLIRGTSHQKLYDESGFSTLKERRRRHKLIAYKKIILGLYPNYLSAIIPPLVSANNPYPRRRPQERVLPHCRTEIYRKSFIPSTTELWNNLPLSVKNSQSISEFKRYLSSFDPVIPLYYYAGDRIEQIIHCRLRSGMSDLNEDLYSRHIQLNRSCSCGYRYENARHYLLFCVNFIEARRNTIYSLPADWIDTQTLLFGSPRLNNEENVAVVLRVHEFIRLTKRFS